MGRKQRKEQDNRLNSHYCIKIYYNYMTNIKLYEINVNELNTSIKRQIIRLNNNARFKYMHFKEIVNI